MAVNPRTIARLEARIRERAAYCVEFELSDPRSALVTVTRVELANDASTGRIYYSVYGTESEKSKVAHMLVSAAGFIQRKVARVLKLRRTPHLTWYYDDSIEKAAEVDSAIRKALERDLEIHAAGHAAPEEEPDSAAQPDADAAPDETDEPDYWDEDAGDESSPVD